MVAEVVSHAQWPKQGECLFGEWMHKTGLPKPTQYRQCVHPKCNKVEVRDTPRGQ